MKVLETAQVVSNHEIRPGIWSMWLEAPEVCQRACPGQFVHVRVEDAFLPLLRRPLSIGRVEAGLLELVWRVIGEGTRSLTKTAVGSSINLLGPLGHPFSVPDGLKQALLVGGGLGLPPLVYLNETPAAKGIPSTLFLGVRGRADIPLADDDPVLAKATVVAELGEGYRQGLVTLPVAETIESLRADGGLSSVGIYSCGPWGLVGALQKLVPFGELLCSEVSLEQQMGCGVGVCQGCAVVAEGGPTPYRLVCSDGPVFDLFQVEVPGGK